MNTKNNNIRIKNMSSLVILWPALHFVLQFGSFQFNHRPITQTSSTVKSNITILPKKKSSTTQDKT